MAIPFTPGTVLPTPTTPYLIDPNDCIGDSVKTLNDNANYLATNIYNVNNNLTNSVNTVSNNLGTVIIYKDVKAQNTPGGTNTAAAWVTRTLNTISVDTKNIGALSNNTFKLVTGTWLVEAMAPAWGVGHHKIKIVDASNNLVVYGTNEFAASNQYFSSSSRSVAHAVITVGVTPVFYSIQHYTQKSPYGDKSDIYALGFAVNASGANEIYTVVKCTKIG